MLKFLLIFILIYIALKFLVKYIFPVLLESYIRRKMSDMQHQHQSSQNYSNNREGNVTINHEENGKKKYSKNTGEYVDFEEIK